MRDYSGMSPSTDNPVALITGGGSGIGRAAALRLAHDGTRVALLEREEGRLADVANEIRSKGGTALELPGDLIDSHSMESVVAKLKHEWGRLDMVVASAGINGVWAPLDEIKIEEWDQTQSINLRGTFITIREALPLLKVRGGSVVIVASVNGTRVFSNTGATAYSCSKAAQVAMTKMLAVELGPSRIRVNAVCPGAIDTNIGESTKTRHLEDIKIPVEFPKGAIPLTGNSPGTPEDVAELIAFLVSERARHITGSEIYIDGAQSLLQG